MFFSECGSQGGGLFGGFGPKVAAGFLALEAFGYRYYEVLLGSLVLAPEVG